MADVPDYFRIVSEHLSRVLDEIGVSSTAVKERRKMYLIEECISTFSSYILNKFGSENYIFGSQTEGTTTFGLNSDIDILFTMKAFRVIQDWSDWEPGKVNLLMLEEDTPPGYCRLQLLRPDAPLARENLPDANFTYDRCGRVLWKSILSKHALPDCVSNGPAFLAKGPVGCHNQDYVIAVKCESSPKVADDWTKRQCKDWPSQQLMRKYAKNGFFVVPVGFRLSKTQELEWRMSFSYTERLLMFSMNVIMLKCYVVLKMIVKRYIMPFAEENISSYHCKTALLYCLEETGAAFWKRENLLQCINLCLTKLLMWVSNLYCPHYIIPDTNLFAGKVTQQNTVQICLILQTLLDSRGRYLLSIPFDDLNRLLQRKLTRLPELCTRNHTWKYVHSVFPRLSLVRQIFSTQSEIQLKYIRVDPVSLIQVLCEKHMFLSDRLESANRHKRVAVRITARLLMCLIGSVMASLSLSYNRRIPTETLQWFIKGAGCDIASLLKLASTLFNNGDIHSTERILQRLAKRFSMYEIKPICRCSDFLDSTSRSFYLQECQSRSLNDSLKKVAFCVRFAPQEIHCAPPAFRSEFYTSVGDDLQHRNPRKDKWMALAVADSLPYLYFLQYLTYGRLGQRDLQVGACFNLQECVKQAFEFRHLETAWNMLGQCMELEHRPEVAADCYRTSLEIRPRNNAANWHIQNLCYRRIRNEV